MNIVKLTSEELGEAAAFVARLQADKAHQIAYFGDDPDEIAAAIQSFDPPCNAVLAYEDDVLVGVLGVDTDAESQRAWLYGPLVDHADWGSTADALYEAVLQQEVLPPHIRDQELFADVANTNLAAFASRHGFTPGAPQASLRLGREMFDRLDVQPVDESVQIVELTKPLQVAFIAMHDEIFPHTYYSGREIVERLGERDKAFIALYDTVLIGYLFARIEQEATNGYIDFLGVTEKARRRGIGTRLVRAAAEWLFTFPEIDEVTLTVDAGNAAAIALYTALGFEQTQTLQVYRKQ